MASISQIRAALKTRLDTISGLNVYDTIPGQVNTPAVVIRRRRGPTPATFGNERHDYEFALTVVTSPADDRAAQEKLDVFLSGDGASSIIEVLDADSDLQDLVDFAIVRDIEEDSLLEYGGTSYLGADIVVDIGSA